MFMYTRKVSRIVARQLRQLQFRNSCKFSIQSFKQLRELIEPYATKIYENKVLVSNLKPLASQWAHKIIDFQITTGIPWWTIIIFSCLAIRIPLYPLTKLTRKLFFEFPILPTLKWIFLALTTLNPTSIVSRIELGLRSMREMTKKQSESTPLFLIHKLFHYPLVILISYLLMEILVPGSLTNSNFLYIDNLSKIDPYFILPSLTTLLNYINCSRFIRKTNRNQLITQFRILFRSLLIVLYPILCCLPSGVNLFLLANACYTLFENRLTNPERGLFVIRVILMLLSGLFVVGCLAGQLLGIKILEQFEKRWGKS